MIDALVGDEMLVPLDHLIDGRLVATEARLDGGSWQATLSLSIHIKGESLADQRAWTVEILG